MQETFQKNNIDKIVQPDSTPCQVSLYIYCLMAKHFASNFERVDMNTKFSKKHALALHSRDFEAACSIGFHCQRPSLTNLCWTLVTRSTRLIKQFITTCTVAMATVHVVQGFFFKPLE